MFWIIIIIILCLLSLSGATAYYFMFMGKVDKVVCTDGAFLTRFAAKGLIVPGKGPQFVGITDLKCSNSTTLADATISPIPTSAISFPANDRSTGFSVESVRSPSMLSGVCANTDKLVGYIKDPVDNSFKFVCK